MRNWPGNDILLSQYMPRRNSATYGRNRADTKAQPPRYGSTTQPPPLGPERGIVATCHQTHTPLPLHPSNPEKRAGIDPKTRRTAHLITETMINSLTYSKIHADSVPFSPLSWPFNLTQRSPTPMQINAPNLKRNRTYFASKLYCEKAKGYLKCKSANSIRIDAEYGGIGPNTP